MSSDADAPSKGEKARVLMVDDEPDFVQIVRGWLSPHYRFYSAYTGDDLMWTIGERRPDAVILDVNLPDLDGFELCRAIRETKRFAAVPIVFLTASRDKDHPFKSWRAGGSKYMTKPVTRAELLSTLSQLLARPVLPPR